MKPRQEEAEFAVLGQSVHSLPDGVTSTSSVYHLPTEREIPDSSFSVYADTGNFAALRSEVKRSSSLSVREEERYREERTNVAAPFLSGASLLSFAAWSLAMFDSYTHLNAPLYIGIAGVILLVVSSAARCVRPGYPPLVIFVVAQLVISLSVDLTGDDGRGAVVGLQACLASVYVLPGLVDALITVAVFTIPPVILSALGYEPVSQGVRVVVHLLLLWLKVHLDKAARKSFDIIRKEEEKKSSEMKTISAGMSEVFAPLTGILGIAEILKDTEAPRERQLLLDHIVSVTDMVLTTMANTTDYFKILHGEYSPETFEFCLDRVVEDVVRDAAPLARERGIEIFLYIGPHPDSCCMVLGDPKHIRFIIYTFITYSINSTGSSCNGPINIEVTVREESSMVVVGFTIEDHSQGLTHEEASNFYNEIEGFSPMALVRLLCSMLGGKVSLVTSRGMGTTYYCCLSLEPVKGGVERCPLLYDPSTTHVASPLVAGPAARLDRRLTACTSDSSVLQHSSSRSSVASTPSQISQPAQTACSKLVLLSTNDDLWNFVTFYVVKWGLAVSMAHCREISEANTLDVSSDGVRTLVLIDEMFLEWWDAVSSEHPNFTAVAVTDKTIAEGTLREKGLVISLKKPLLPDQLLRMVDTVYGQRCPRRRNVSRRDTLSLADRPPGEGFSSRVKAAQPYIFVSDFSTQEQEKQEKPAAPRYCRRQLNVLLAGKNVVTTRVLRHHLQKLQHAVVLAQSCEAACLELKGRPRFDLIIIDLESGQQGLLAMRNLRVMTDTLFAGGHKVYPTPPPIFGITSGRMPAYVASQYRQVVCLASACLAQAGLTSTLRRPVRLHDLEDLIDVLFLDSSATPSPNLLQTGRSPLLPPVHLSS